MKQAINIRQSNAELLRLVCMFMIVLLHFTGYVMYPGELSIVPRTWDEAFFLYGRGFIIVGVNCFVLLSGYFLIKPSWRSFVHLFATFSFYAFFIALLELRTLDYSVLHSIVYVLKYTILPFSSCHYWFLSCYLVLYFLSPILNAGIESMQKMQFKLLIVVLTILNVFVGNICQNEYVNLTGYNVMQFIYCYLLGGYIRRYLSFDFIKKHRRVWLGVFSAASLLWGGVAYLSGYHNIRVLNWLMWREWTYNSIPCMCSSVAFFMFMMSFDFKSKVVNWLASSCLAIYIVQQVVYESDFCMVTIKGFSAMLTPSTRILCTLAFTFVAWLLPIFIEKLRMLIMKQVELLVAEKLERKITLFNSSSKK